MQHSYKRSVAPQALPAAEAGRVLAPATPAAPTLSCSKLILAPPFQPSRPRL